MVSSPPPPPPPPPATATQAQLLQELEALNQALHQAQQHQKSPRQPPPKSLPPVGKSAVSSFLPRRASSQEAIARSGREEARSLPSKGSSNLSRHSLHLPSQRAEQPAVKQRLSASAAATRPKGLVEDAGKVDIRSRHNHRPALQAWQSHATVVEEEEPPVDNSSDFSLNLEIPLEKKKSIWNWKPLRALTHIGRQRFVCIVLAHVHAIQGVPAGMNGLRLVVHIRKKETREGAVQTMPSRVFQGVAEFRETLHLKCSVYGTKNPSQSMKFMSRDLILSVIAPDADELELGKHQLDISRLLVDQVDDRRGGIGKLMSFATSFDLSGKAKGAKVFVTFNYEYVEKDWTASGDLDSRFTGSPTHRTTHTSYSLPNSAHATPRGLTGRSRMVISPSISEPGNDMADVLKLDQLSLDELIPVVEQGNEILRGTDSRVQAHRQGEGEYSGHQVSTGLPRLERNSLHDEAAFKAEFRNFNDFDSRKLLDHGSGLKPKSIDLEQKHPVSEKKPRKSISNDPPLAPSTPRQSFDSSEFTREKSLTWQIHEKNCSSEEDTEFDVVDQAIERDELKKLSPIQTKLDEDEIGKTKLESANASYQTTDMPDLSKKEPNSLQTQSNMTPPQVMNEIKKEIIQANSEKEVTTQMILRTLETLLQGTTAIEMSHMDAMDEKTESQYKEEIDASEPSSQKKLDRDKEINLDNEANLVAGEFLDMLGVGTDTLCLSSDSEPDSPRAKLLKQFEKEAWVEGGIGIDLDNPAMPMFKSNDVPYDTSTGIIMSKNATNLGKEYDSEWDSDDDKELASIVMVAESELNRATQSIRSKTRAKLLEDAETVALMHEWGLNDKAFTNSPLKSEHGSEEIVSACFCDQLAISKELCPVVPLKDGGSLRTVNLTHFQPYKSDVNLVMQVSRPVVVPVDMGSSAIDVLRSMASMGMESMATQAMTIMPLEDITGKTFEQIRREGTGAWKVPNNDLSMSTATNFGTRISQRMNDEFFSLHDITPMAMHQIEALAIEGLKIQADMTDDDAPFALNAFSLADAISSTTSRGGENENGIQVLKGVAGMPLYQAEEIPDRCETAVGTNGLMSMALTLDEWIHLDEGLYDSPETDKKASKAMAAHYDTGSDCWKRSRRDTLLGCTGNTLTIAVLVQLYDPLRNYEAVGCPMIALVQAERVISPPKIRLGGKILMKGDKEEGEDADRGQFKIAGVHMAGLKSLEDDKKKGWGDQRQQQSGSRWLIAHGMAKHRKNHPFLKSAPDTVTTSARVKTVYSESLWSISARSYGSGSRWKEVEKPNSHIRNPDVVFASRSLRRR